ncbi:hypothetical protein LAZ67_2006278 [Cordylochernes scorpioides]|uniref:Reverse transcriptase domain-containing protein n=1 Tax=Cordylochernes scorpioides TaxID=51811 RepID=A0ABY6K8G4_9ARAC|nr:hypothetical protein LAZ67_2006278 [Cordylochernes scorpioides]
MDQRTCIKICVKNEIKCADAFRMLTVAYGEATLDRSNVYRWYKMFSEGREDVNDEERAGRPSTSTTDEKINEVEKMILANRRITVREVAEDLNISIGSCHSIFINDLGMRRVAAKFVPKLLNCDQKQHRMNIANEMLDSVRDDLNLLQRVITGDEAWVYGYDVETKAQSSQWKLPHEPRPKKARQVRSNVKVLLTVFFDCRGVVHHEFLPQGRKVNKEYYLQVMRNLREAIRQKRPDLWKNKNWLLHHDNAPAHTSLLVRDFLAKNNTLMMPQPPYSPDLAPCDFFLFLKLKRPMKGRRYATLDEIKTASMEELKNIFKNDFFEVLRRLEKPLAQNSDLDFFNGRITWSFGQMGLVVAVVVLALVLGRSVPQEPDWDGPEYVHNAMDKIQAAWKGTIVHTPKVIQNMVYAAMSPDLTDLDIDTACQQALIQVLAGLKNGQLWAVKKKKPIIQGEIDIKEWFLFYKNLLNKENKEATFTVNQMIGWKDPDLDAEITLEEIHDVVKKLANGKAVGLDGIPNELLKNLPIPTLNKLKNLFNKIMSTEKYPQLWTNSIVHPIYKSGDKNNPTNYRGIALCSNISKLFTTILSNRLNNWIEKRVIILENQAGFRKNRSCTDHIILLNSLIQLSLRRKRGKLYVFFVDLTKAFDTVPHDLLWQKLHKMGISNKFVMLIKNFYQEAKITIRWKGQYSNNVKINSGVLQGESLSPLLFILYMADLIELYNNSALTGFHLPDFGVLHLLMYADDIAIIGESKINLQIKINLLKSYLDKNKLVLNENKSKIIVFRNGGRPARHENWYWGDTPLTVASNITYLGYPFTSTINSKKVPLFYKAKANTAINATIRLIKKKKINSLKVALNLFDSVIKSILLYAAPVWAWDNTDIIDQLQNTFIKNFLNLPRYIPGYIVRLETGRISLTFTMIKLILKYFIRLQKMEDNRLPKLCWNRLKEISLMTKKPIGFCKNIMDIINHCGLTWLNYRLNYDDIQIELPNILKIKIEQLLQQDLAKLSLTKTYSNYRLLYDSFIPENYFSCNLSSALVSFIAQIRLMSTMIKENHIYAIKKEDLYCGLCGSQITDEIYHFIAECGDLEGERKKILISLPRPHLNSIKLIKTVSDKKSPTRCREVLETLHALAVPLGYYRFDPRLPQLIARVDEVLQQAYQTPTYYYRESTGSQHIITESRQDYHNEGDHNEEGKDCPDRKEPRSKDGGTSTPFQRNDQAIFPPTTQPNIPQNKPVRSYPPSTLQRNHPDDMPPSPNRSHKLLQALHGTPSTSSGQQPKTKSPD